MLFAGLTAVSGAASARWLIAPRILGRRRHTLVAAARGVGIGGSATLAVGVGLVFWRQLRDFRDPIAPWTQDAALLLGTDWGLAWRLVAAGALLAPVAFACAAPDARARGFRQVAWVIATVLSAAMCAFPAFTGHAAATGDLRWLSIPADVVHVLAAGSWIGGLLLVLVAERMERGRTGRGHALLAETLPHFTPVALIAAALLIGTGAFAAYLHVESLDALASSRYGRVLLVKTGLVVIVLILGAINWRLLTPRLWGTGGAGPLRRNAIRELVIAHLVILVSALLVRTPPLEG